jgi:hypothetical protein
MVMLLGISIFALFLLQLGLRLAINPRARQQKALRQSQQTPMPDVPAWMAPRPDSAAFLVQTRFTGILLVIGALGLCAVIVISVVRGAH